MSLELFADEIDGRLHAAVAQKGMLHNLFVDRRETKASWCSLYVGKVIKIDTKLDAAFVDLGGGLTGFLPAKHVHLPGADASEQRTGIAQLLKSGQVLTVQVKSEAKRELLHENHKLPRLTTKIYTFGQNLIYSPLSSQVTISRRIVRDDLLKFTAKLKGRGGWIVQHSAETAAESDILCEADSLLADWQAIGAEIEAGGNAPRLVRAGPNALFRALNDYGAHSFDHIYAGNRKLLDDVSAWSAKYQPGLAGSKRLRLFKAEPGLKSLLDTYDLSTAIEALAEPVVALPSGGSLIIEPTHAVVVIDVNQGAAGGITGANIEAAREAARQIRLRNLSGAILIDFINMAQRGDRARVLDELTAACDRDMAGLDLHGFTRIGIAEITRKRRTGMLQEKMKG